LFPHRKEGVAQTEDQKEEERRLFYVALTRAKKKLFLSYASIRTVFGMREITAPSEFVYDIPEDLVEREWGKNIKTIYI
jgi:DNA helicase-2/ATP-dependent DNA helicase PcrA